MTIYSWQERSEAGLLWTGDVFRLGCVGSVVPVDFADLEVPAS